MSAPETGEDPLFRERRSFKRACISAALALLFWAAAYIFSQVNAAKIAGMIAAGSFSTQEIHRQRIQWMAVMDWLALGIVFCAMAFGIYFARWLVAVSRRRKQGQGLPPSER